MIGNTASICFAVRLGNRATTFPPRSVSRSSFLLAFAIPGTTENLGFLVLGLLTTATGMYLGLESTVLRFPSRLRPQFRSWFLNYERLRGLIPNNSEIELRGSSVDPDFLLTQLLKMNRESLETQHFDHFVAEIEGVFVGMERKLRQAREAINDIKRRQISREILEETQRVTASVENYTEAMQTVHEPLFPSFAPPVNPLSEENEPATQPIQGSGNRD